MSHSCVLPSSPHRRYLHSFPTRRSSDLRLDPETERSLTRLARSSGRSRSAIIRDAILRLSEETAGAPAGDRKSTRLNSSHEWISYAVFCLKKKKSRIENSRKESNSFYKI